MRLEIPSLGLDLGEPRTYAIVGPAPRVVDMIAGTVRSRVRVDGREPHGDPNTRRTIGSLLAEETLVPARTVGESIERSLALRGARGRALHTLDRFGLSTWESRAVTSLAPDEARVVALSLALATPDARLYAFDAPFPALRSAGVDARSLSAALTERSVLTLCVVASVAEATTLDAEIVLVTRRPFATSGDITASTEDAEKLVEALVKDPAVLGATWTGERVRVHAGTTGEAALALARAVNLSGARVSRLGTSS